MSKQVAVLAVHGMGDTPRDFDRQIRRTISRRLGGERWRRVHWQPVYYQRVLQDNQRALMSRMLAHAELDWIRLRRFVLYGFSDAAGMESRPQFPGSVYERIQAILVDALRVSMAALESPHRPVVVVAHSLGCQVVSNYLWDAQQTRASAGVFRGDVPEPVSKHSLEGQFLRLKTLRSLLTSGCNIPVFIAGLPPDKIEPVIVDERGWQFEWENYYDPDDALGWPLRPINRAYRRAVSVEKSISSGGLLTSWNPLAHNAYWQDDAFVRPVERAIRALL